MVVKPAKDLWCDYLFLTREMAKFISLGDMDLLQSLADQREQLQQLIEQHSDKAFVASAEGRKILDLIVAANTTVDVTLKARYNRAKQQDFVERAYAGGMAAPTAGGFMNKKG